MNSFIDDLRFTQLRFDLRLFNNMECLVCHTVRFAPYTYVTYPSMCYEDGDVAI